MWEFLGELLWCLVDKKDMCKNWRGVVEEIM